jgi:hypothetical protein
MKVGELIQALKQLDENIPVVLPGMMGGFENISDLSHVPLVLGVYKTENWRGEHEALDKIRELDRRTPEAALDGPSDVQRYIAKVRSGQAKVDLTQAVCLRGPSNL